MQNKLFITYKTKHAVHYATLKCYNHHGLVIKRVHKVILFRQSTAARPSHLQSRSQKNDNQSDQVLIKHVTGIAFGKSIENVKQRMYVKY